MRYDVVVVGGGTAGCVLAARLSEDPARQVCLIEAGPDYGPYDEGRWPADLLDARSLAFSHSWETEREDRSQLRARVLGGCSTHNACIVVRGAPEDYDEWGPGWTAAELTPFLDRAERMLEPRVFADEEIAPWQRGFRDAAGPDAIVHGLNAKGTVRWNLAFAYLDEARARPNLAVHACTLVDRVVVEGTRATGVVTPDGDVAARTVILSAGAYGSPGILLRSGVGPEAGLPVGEGLLDHVGVGLGWEPTPRLTAAAERFVAEHPLFLAQVTVAARSRSCPEGLWDLFLFPALERSAEGGFEATAAAFAMKPRSRGRVSLTSPDPRAPLRVEHGFLSDESDVGLVADAVERVRALVAAEPLASLAAREVRPGPQVAAEEHARAAARGFFHPTGTCALGRVVDREARVVGLDELYVADASIMPTIPRVNTNLTTAAIAERVAAALA